VARLVYSAITSLDGYVTDRDGRFDWAAPDEEVHAFVNDLERGIGTYLYGRRMYEVMVAWETMPLSGASPATADFAQVWRAAEKVVYSTTLGLGSVASARTRLERSFDADAVRSLVASSPSDVSMGGPTLAAEALRAGLVDDIHLFLTPIVVGGGTAALPEGVRLELELVAERRFAGGVVHVHHRRRS
jgi:dihydrofolate reductase